MTGSCGVDVGTLWDLVDGAVDEDRQRELREHAARCPECAERLARIERLDAGLAAVADEEQAPEPQAIGSYRVIRRIGEGGMGVVYEARQTHPDRAVAVKVMRPVGSCTPRDLRAFRREIQALGRLSHPSIATVHDAGRLDDGRLYLVMELVRGAPLDHFCDREALGLRERVALVVRIADAVHHAHERGIVHRDLKPTNVLVDEAGKPMLLDFGLARFLNRDDDVTVGVTATAFGSPVGTLPYLAPERLRGDYDNGTDVQADVYALGVVLHELVTGRRPYEFDDCNNIAAVQRLVAATEPPHPSRILVDVPRALGDVIATATAKERRRRYATTKAFADDLRRFLAGDEVSARPPGWPHRARRLVARYAGVLAGALAAGVIGIGTLAWIGDSDDKAARPTTTILPITRAALPFRVFGRQFDFSLDGARAVHKIREQGNELGGLGIWHRPTSITTPLALPHEQFASPRWSPDGDRIAMLDLGPPAQRGVSVLHVVTGELTSLYVAGGDRRPLDLVWTPEGDRITFTTNEPAVYDLSLDGTLARWRLTTESGLWHLGGYSRDGRWLLALVVADISGLRRAADLWLVPRGGGGARQLTASAAHEQSAALEPDGSAVWFVRNDGPRSDLFRLRLDPVTGAPTAAPEPIWGSGDRRLRDIAFAGQNDLVCGVSRDESEIWIREPGSEARALTMGREPVLAPAGDTLFYLRTADGRSDLTMLDVHDPAAPVTLAEAIVTGMELAGGPPPYDVANDGGRVVYCAAEGDAFGLFEVAALEGARPRLLATATTPVVPRWSRDGSQVAYVDDDRLFVIDRDDQQPRELAQSVWKWEPWTVQWSPVDDVLLVVGYETPEEFPEINTVFVVDAGTGAARRLTPVGDDYKEGVTWHPDGTRITCLVYADTGERIRDIRVDDGSSATFFDHPGHCPYLGAWAPDGRYVFWCSGGPGCQGGQHVVLPEGTVQYDGHGIRNPPRWSAGETFVWLDLHLSWHLEQLRGVR